MQDKPLFIPLNKRYYDAFESGEKRIERRIYGKRWNERTCYSGRQVVLSCGYGKKRRMTGRIAYSLVLPFTEIEFSDNRADLLNCFGERVLKELIIIIGIEL